MAYLDGNLMPGCQLRNIASHLEFKTHVRMYSPPRNSALSCPSLAHSASEWTSTKTQLLWPMCPGITVLRSSTRDVIAIQHHRDRG
jgi:hypothetical protein